MGVSLAIRGWDQHVLADGGRYTTYEIVISDGKASWSVHKRYRQFEELRSSVRGLSAAADKYNFPHKSRFNTFSEWTKERRQKGFDEFLQLLLKIEPMPPQLVQFLELDIATHVAGGDGNGDGVASSSSETEEERNNAGSGSGRDGRQKRPGTSSTHRRRGSKESPRKKTPRFPPLASEPPRASGKMRSSNVSDRLDALVGQVLTPLLLTIVVVLVCVVVTVVSVWKVSGKAGVVMLVVGVCVGTLIQNHAAVTKLVKG
ncbi:unnamed protein product [Chrysoparadoxa australica]